MPEIVYEEFNQSRPDKYPVTDWIQSLKDKTVKWSKGKQDKPQPHLKLVPGRDFDIKVDSMVQYLYRWNNDLEEQEPISIHRHPNDEWIKIFWWGEA